MNLRNILDRKTIKRLFTNCKKREREIYLREKLTSEKYHRKNHFGLLRYAVNAPIFKKNTKGLYFDSTGEEYSKSGTALAEILRNGFLINDEKIIIGAKKSPINILIRITRALLYRIIFFKFISHIKTKKNLTETSCAALIGTVAFERFFKKNTTIFPFVCSDTSINYLILAEAANLHSGIFWWQDDFHHKSLPEWKIAAAGVLTNDIYEKIKIKNPGARIMKRANTKKKDLSIKKNYLAIGVAVNATFTASHGQMVKLKSIKDFFEVNALNLRLHPTAERNINLPDWIVLSDQFETVEEYAGKNDLVFVGNSAIQLKIVAYGTPVIHTDNLDPEGYDIYHYVQNNVIYGATNIKSIDIHKMNLFYTSSSYKARLNKFLI